MLKFGPVIARRLRRHRPPNKAARGELRRGLPVGFVWGEEDGEVRFHPDAAVTSAGIASSLCSPQRREGIDDRINSARPRDPRK